MRYIEGSANDNGTSNKDDGGLFWRGGVDKGQKETQEDQGVNNIKNENQQASEMCNDHNLIWGKCEV